MEEEVLGQGKWVVNFEVVEEDRFRWIGIEMAKEATIKFAILASVNDDVYVLY